MKIGQPSIRISHEAYTAAADSGMFMMLRNSGFPAYFRIRLGPSAVRLASATVFSASLGIRINNPAQIKEE